MHRTLSRKGTGRRRWVGVAYGCLAVVLSLPAAGQDVSELTGRDEPVPSHYESWSLFLICNPSWLVRQSDERLVDLYDQFLAFGGVLGVEHVAVWFWLGTPDATDLRYSIDVVRSSAYCSSFELEIDKGPYVVVTTDYPGSGLLADHPDSFQRPENLLAIGLNGAASEEITRTLTDLAQRILAERVFEAEPQSEDFWDRWQAAFESTRSALVGFTNRVSVSFKTQFFSVDLGPEDGP